MAEQKGSRRAEESGPAATDGKAAGKNGPRFQLSEKAGSPPWTINAYGRFAMSNRWWKHMLVGGALLWVLTGCGGGTDQETNPLTRGKPPPRKKQHRMPATGRRWTPRSRRFTTTIAPAVTAPTWREVRPALTNTGSKYSKEEIDDIIKNGKGQMPAQTQLSDAERESLSAWLAEQK